MEEKKKSKEAEEDHSSVDSSQSFPDEPKLPFKKLMIILFFILVSFTIGSFGAFYFVLEVYREAETTTPTTAPSLQPTSSPTLSPTSSPTASPSISTTSSPTTQTISPTFPSNPSL